MKNLTKITKFASAMMEKLLVPKVSYPLARKDESVVDDYHGQKISDPYRWLEDPDSADTKAYVDQLNAVSTDYIKQCPVIDKIRHCLKDLWDYPKYGCPQKEGNYYFYNYNTGLQNQSVLYKQEKLAGEATVFLDPNALSADGTTSISLRSFTDDGTILAYGLSEKGSDWVTVKFKNTVDGVELNDKLERLRYSSLEWTRNNKGVFYNKFPDSAHNAVGTTTAKNEFHQMFYHYLGTEQKNDILCFEFPDHPEYMMSLVATEDGKYLVVSVDQGCDPKNLVYFYDLAAVNNEIKGKLDLKPIIDKYEARFNYVTNEGPVFTFLTDFDAPMFKLIQIDITNSSKENWKTLVAEQKNKLDWAACVNHDFLVICYIEDVKNVLHVHDLKSGSRLYTLPLEIGSVTAFSGKKKHSEIFYTFQSFLTPSVMYHLDLAKKDSKPTIFRQVDVKNIEPENYEVKQVFYRSKDGTKVPMFIFHKKGIQLDGQNPTLLYGYGGFNCSMMPYFSVLRVFFVRYFNGIVAIPNIRGGDEYGKIWHESGMKEKKQNVFDDFIAAAEYLQKNEYTNRDKLVIEGHSNGGLLVAACANQRPDLFGCILNGVGVLDMLRFQRFTIGQAWVPEFGCSKTKTDFDVLIKYSPLHNLKAPKPDEHYPAMLLSTADHDDRVVPLHSLKYMAHLYDLLKDIDVPKNPVLIRIEVKAGHGAGKPTSKIIDERTDIYAFLYKAMDLKWHD